MPLRELHSDTDTDTNPTLHIISAQQSAEQGSKGSAVTIMTGNQGLGGGGGSGWSREW